MPHCTFVLGVISDKSEDDKFIVRLKKFCDVFHLFKTYDDIHTGVQSKITRCYLSTLYDKDVCTIVDIDQYVFDYDWLNKKLEPAFNERKFVSVGGNAYLNSAADGKWPMPYTTAPSDIFKKIVNYQDYTSYESWLFSFKTIENPIDNYENITNPFVHYSDESTLRWIMGTHPDQDFIKDVWVKQNREDYNGKCHTRRIDRGWWEQSYDFEKLKQGFYIDSWPVRPFHKNYKRLIPLLEHLGVPNDPMNLLI